MIKIDLLKNHPGDIQKLVKIWYEVLGKIWSPDIDIHSVEEKFRTHLNNRFLPLTFIAFYNKQPIGMCSLRIGDCREILVDSIPWLGGLVVDQKYQKKGIGRKLIDITKKKACELGIQTLYLFTFNSKMPQYYEQLGWKNIGSKEYEDKTVTIMSIDL